jgi:L-fucose mutarotase
VLKGIDELVSADLLYALAAMGHGDELAVVDRNFPAASTARRLIRLDGADVTQAGRAILSLLPLDTFVDAPVLRMEVVGSPAELPTVQKEFLALCEATEQRPLTMGSLTRDAFYERARHAFAVVATSESRPYGCFLLTKGVIFEP